MTLKWIRCTSSNKCEGNCLRIDWIKECVLLSIDFGSNAKMDGIIDGLSLKLSEKLQSPAKSLVLSHASPVYNANDCDSQFK